MAKEKIDGKTLLYSKLRIIASRNERLAIIHEEVKKMESEVKNSLGDLKILLSQGDTEDAS